MADSQATLVGNLTKDFDLRFTNGGKATASAGIAVSRRYQVNNEWKEETSFFNVVVWGQMAENAAASFTKGTRVIATGRMQQRNYEKDGEQKSVVELVVDDIGASVKWTTCDIVRVERDKSAAPSQKRSSGKRPEYEDEEPF